jgi:hypothetical protein
VLRRATHVKATNVRLERDFFFDNLLVRIHLMVEMTNVTQSNWGRARYATCS